MSALDRVEYALADADRFERNSASINCADVREVIASMTSLYAVLTEAREDILRLANARWSEVEATDAEMVDYIDAALAQARGEAA